jgi:mRNA export factor
MWDGQAPSRNIPQQIGAHDAPVKSVGYLPSGLVASGGWDRKLKFWDKRQPNPAGQLDMPGKIQDLDIRDNLMVVATHDRHIISFNVAGAQPVEHLPRKKSSLDFQTRCVSCFPDSKGYAVGSIGGRVQIQYLQEDKPGKKSFPFMCHRQDRSAFSINAIAFNSKYGTFVTAGSDGVINTWDKNLKRRVGKASEPIGRPITCANFNAQGNLLAYASSYDWSKGSTHDVQQGNEIFIHYVLEEEIKPKGKNPPASPRAY